MQLTTTLLESDGQIIQAILKGLLSDTKKYMNKITKKLEPEIQNIVRDGFLASPEYRSLLSGDLRVQFGLSEPSTKLSQILDIWNMRSYSPYFPVFTKAIFNLKSAMSLPPGQSRRLTVKSQKNLLRARSNVSVVDLPNNFLQPLFSFSTFGRLSEPPFSSSVFLNFSVHDQFS